MDTHNNHFILCNEENCITVFEYEQRSPIKHIPYNELEQQSGVKTSDLAKRRIIKIAFDPFSHQRIFACLSHTFCCVYNLDNLTKPMAFLTPSTVETLHNSACQEFRSFAFWQNSSLCILTNNEIIRWNYASSGISSIFELDRPASSLHMLADGSLLEVVRPPEILLYSCNVQDAVLRGSSKVNFQIVKRLVFAKDFEYDSFFNSRTKHYFMSLQFFQFINSCKSQE